MILFPAPVFNNPYYGVHNVVYRHPHNRVIYRHPLNRVRYRHPPNRAIYRHPHNFTYPVNNIETITNYSPNIINRWYSSIILKNNDRILMLYNSSKSKWVIPGNIIKNGEKRWNSACKDYYNKTGGNIMPTLYNKKEYRFNSYKTYIFLCKTDQDIVFNRNNKMSHAKWVRIKDIKNNINRLQIDKCTIKILKSLIRIDKL